MKRYILLSLLFFSLFSCGGRGGNKEKDFNDNKLVSKVYEQIIKVEEAKLYNDALLFQKQMKDFSANPSEVALQQLRTQWLVLAKDWARCFAFNIGDVKDESFFLYLAHFPVNAASLEDYLEKVKLEELTPKYVLNRFGVATKGLYGIEYLLYKDDLATTFDALIKDKKRMKALELIIDELMSDITNNKNKWEEYASKFLANKEGKDNINSSFNQIFAGLDNVIHYAWETKVGKAIRKDDIEARYSKTSLELLRENVAITKHVYFDGGIADKVKLTMNGSETINDAIKTRYQKIEKTFDDIDEALVFAVKSSEQDKVKKLMDELKALELIEFAKVETVLKLIDGTKEGDGD